MTRGMCARCKKGSDCKFREPGTWVVECDEFEEDSRLVGRHMTPDLSLSDEAPNTNDGRRKADD